MSNGVVLNCETLDPDILHGMRIHPFPIRPSNFSIVRVGGLIFGHRNTSYYTSHGIARRTLHYATPVWDMQFFGSLFKAFAKFKHFTEHIPLWEKKIKEYAAARDNMDNILYHLRALHTAGIKLSASQIKQGNKLLEEYKTVFGKMPHGGWTDFPKA